jgi:hypothetical protein
VDDSYFDSYSGFNIHREMISDKVRAACVSSACTKSGLKNGWLLSGLMCGEHRLSNMVASLFRIACW